MKTPNRRVSPRPSAGATPLLPGDAGDWEAAPGLRGATSQDQSYPVGSLKLLPGASIDGSSADLAWIMEENANSEGVESRAVPPTEEAA